MKEVFEIHLAVPKLNEFMTQQIRDALTSIGFNKNKYFQRVRDLKPITPGCSNGHDLENPGIMSTTHLPSLEEAIELAKRGMVIARELGIAGVNFEVERVLCSKAKDLRGQVSQLLGDFRAVPNSPQFENHLIYKGLSGEIPTDETINELLEANGFALNQIVDFTREEHIEPSTIISRVATIYQSGKEQSQEAHEKLKALQSHLGNPRIITEEVLFVGEFKEMTSY